MVSLLAFLWILFLLVTNHYSSYSSAWHFCICKKLKYILRFQLIGKFWMWGVYIGALFRIVCSILKSISTSINLDSYYVFVFCDDVTECSEHCVFIVFVCFYLSQVPVVHQRNWYNLSKVKMQPSGHFSTLIWHQICCWFFNVLCPIQSWRRSINNF